MNRDVYIPQRTQARSSQRRLVQIKYNKIVKSRQRENYETSQTKMICPIHGNTHKTVTEFINRNLMGQEIVG